MSENPFLSLCATLCDGDRLLAEKRTRLPVEEGELVSLSFGALALHVEILFFAEDSVTVAIETTRPRTLVYDRRELVIPFSTERAVSVSFSVDPENSLKKLTAVIYFKDFGY